jgi:hypothetical protein
MCDECFKSMLSEHCDSFTQGWQPLNCSQLIDCHLLFCQSVEVITMYIYVQNSETNSDFSCVKAVYI